MNDKDFRSQILGLADAVEVPNDAKDDTGTVLRVKLTSILELIDSGELTDGYHTFKELYTYRMLYNAALFNQWAQIYDSKIDGRLHDVHKSWKHSDGKPCFGGGWFVVVAQLPTGQITNHYKAEHWDLFKIPARDMAAEYDGHTPDDVAKRLMEFLYV